MCYSYTVICLCCGKDGSVSFLICVFTALCTQLVIDVLLRMSMCPKLLLCMGSLPKSHLIIFTVNVSIRHS